MKISNFLFELARITNALMSGLSQVNKMRIIKFGSKGMLLGPLSALYRRIRFLLVQTRIRCK